jgi:hypothetical protein
MSHEPWTKRAVAKVSGSAAIGALCSEAFGLLDLALRSNFGSSLARHVILGLSLELAWGAACGAALGLLSWLVAVVERRAPLGRGSLRPIAAGLLAVLAEWSTAWWAFSGARIARTAWSSVGPVLVILALAIAVGGVTWLWQLAELRRRWALLLSLGLVLLAASLVFVDVSFLVSLYARLHGLLESGAWLCLWSVGAFWMGRSPQPQSVRWAAQSIAWCALTLALALGSFANVSAFWSEGLAHSLSDEVYVGRTLRRLEGSAAWLQNPTGALGKTSTTLRLEKLLQHYDIRSSSVGREWKTAAPPRAAGNPGPSLQRPNIVIFYVDTLRYDVATNPSVMPRYARFLREGLTPRRVYATGSDTGTSLAGITSGRYEPNPPLAGDLLTITARAGYDSSLIVPLSGREILAERRAQFRFPDTTEVVDYEPGRLGFGYKGDRATGPEIVDRALAKLRQPRSKPLFLWLFQLDQHNWQQLPAAYFQDQKPRLPQPAGLDLDPRYLAVARSLDREFERLDAGLRELGLQENTILIFMADHGEALGREGFRAHSVYLWEELLRVPLTLRIPGEAPQLLDAPVSLTDLTPTLAPYLGYSGDYHGEDLHWLARSPTARRRLPILFTSTGGGLLRRVGLLDAAASRKLVLPIDAARPELYDLRAADPDARDLAASQPLELARLLETLVHSPIFPR